MKISCFVSLNGQRLDLSRGIGQAIEIRRRVRYVSERVSASAPAAAATRSSRRRREQFVVVLQMKWSESAIGASMELWIVAARAVGISSIRIHDSA